MGLLEKPKSRRLPDICPLCGLRPGGFHRFCRRCYMDPRSTIDPRDLRPPLYDSGIHDLPIQIVSSDQCVTISRDGNQVRITSNQ